MGDIIDINDALGAAMRHRIDADIISKIEEAVMYGYFTNGDVVRKKGLECVYVYFSGALYQMYDQSKESFAIKKFPPSEYVKVGKLQNMFEEALKHEDDKS